MSLSSIIKYAAVVEHRPEEDVPPPLGWSLGGELPVIKRQVLDGGHPPPAHRPPPTKDALLDELNRVRVQVADVRRELQNLTARAETAREEIAVLEEQREALEKLDGLTIDDQAKAILREAEGQAAGIIELARQEAADSVDQLRAQGYLDGLEQGANEARERFRAEHDPEIEKLGLLLEEISGMKEALVAQNEKDIVALIITVAERVIGRSLKDDPKTLADMLRDVLQENRREAFVKITLSADLMPAEAKVGDAIRKQLQSLGQQVDVLVDAQAVSGTVLVETPGGFTDLSVPVQLGNLHAAMREE